MARPPGSPRLPLWRPRIPGTPAPGLGDSLDSDGTPVLRGPQQPHHTVHRPPASSAGTRASCKEGAAHVTDIVGARPAHVSCPRVASALCSDLEHDLRIFEPDLIKHDRSAQYGSDWFFPRGTSATTTTCEPSHRGTAQSTRSPQPVDDERQPARWSHSTSHQQCSSSTAEQFGGVAPTTEPHVAHQRQRAAAGRAFHDGGQQS